MFIDHLLNQDTAPLLEQMLRFTEARQRLIMENGANIDTPGYQTQDLDQAKFQKMLSERIKQRDDSPPGTVDFSDISADVQNPHSTLLYHDGNNRSMEQLMSDEAKNALFHNVIVEVLRKQYATLDMALKERVS